MTSTTELLTLPGELDTTEWIESPVPLAGPIEDGDDYYSDIEGTDEDDIDLDKTDVLGEEENVEEDEEGEEGDDGIDNGDVDLDADDDDDEDEDID